MRSAVPCWWRLDRPGLPGRDLHRANPGRVSGVARQPLPAFPRSSLDAPQARLIMRGTFFVPTPSALPGRSHAQGAAWLLSMASGVDRSEHPGNSCLLALNEGS